MSNLLELNTEINTKKEFNLSILHEIIQKIGITYSINIDIAAKYIIINVDNLSNKEDIANNLNKFLYSNPKIKNYEKNIIKENLTKLFNRIDNANGMFIEHMWYDDDADWS